VVDELDPTSQVSPDLPATVRKHVDAGDHERAGASIPDDVLDLFALSGTPEQVGE